MHECVLSCSPRAMDSLSLISKATNRFFATDVSLWRHLGRAESLMKHCTSQHGLGGLGYTEKEPEDGDGRSMKMSVVKQGECKHLVSIMTQVK